MFAFFESRIRPTLSPGTPPPPGLLAFYWHFVRQTRGLYAAMFVTGLAVALIDTLVPVFIGKLVTLMEAPDRAAAFSAATPMQRPSLPAVQAYYARLGERPAFVKHVRDSTP